MTLKLAETLVVKSRLSVPYRANLSVTRCHVIALVASSSMRNAPVCRPSVSLFHLFDVNRVRRILHITHQGAAITCLVVSVCSMDDKTTIFVPAISTSLSIVDH